FTKLSSSACARLGSGAAVSSSISNRVAGTLVHLDDMVFLAARGRRRSNDCFGVGALFRTRPKSERLRIGAALIVWARVTFVEPNDDARATTPSLLATGLPIG